MERMQAYGQTGKTRGNGQTVDMKLEVVVIPVSDVDCAKQFYLDLGWKLDADDSADEQFRVVQLTPPGSRCSILFGKGVTDQPAGSVQGLHLIVSDIDAARAALNERNVYVSDVFHDASGLFHHAGRQGRLSGPHPMRASYGSFASFNDPDGNGWVMQEVTGRSPERDDPKKAAFMSAGELADSLRRAAAAHCECKETIGENGDRWPEWYARFVIDEALKPKPT